jgi:hypothetical protein
MSVAMTLSIFLNNPAFRYVLAPFLKFMNELLFGPLHSEIDVALKAMRAPEEQHRAIL